jgi:hypothetical protein
LDIILAIDLGSKTLIREDHLNETVADPEISKRGGPLQKGGAHPPKWEKNHVFWVSNLEFY